MNTQPTQRHIHRTYWQPVVLSLIILTLVLTTLTVPGSALATDHPQSASGATNAISGTLYLANSANVDLTHDTQATADDGQSTDPNPTDTAIDSNEPHETDTHGISDYPVHLYEATDLETPIATTHTNENGRYSFTTIEPGLYQVGITTTHDGSTYTLDADSTFTIPEPSPKTLTAPTPITTGEQSSNSPVAYTGVLTINGDTTIGGIDATLHPTTTTPPEENTSDREDQGNPDNTPGSKPTTRGLGRADVTTTWGTSTVEIDYATGIAEIGRGTLGQYTTRPTQIADSRVHTITFTDPTNTRFPTNSKYLFSHSDINQRLINIQAINRIGQVQTRYVDDMTGMFFNLLQLTSLDLSGWNTSLVTNMSSMFNSAFGLTSLDLSGWDTHNVTNMSSMFLYASGLTSLDLSGWDTHNVTNMSNMFQSASGLTSLDLSGWDTHNVTNMNSMFQSASGLTSLDLSGCVWQCWCRPCCRGFSAVLPVGFRPLCRENPATV